MQIIFSYILAEATPGGQETGPIDLSQFIWVAVVVALAAFMLIRTRQRLARSRRDRSLSVKQRVDKLRGPKDIYDQINELMARLADLSRQINGQLDTRIAKLQHLLNEADQTIAIMQKFEQTEATLNQQAQTPQNTPTPTEHAPDNTLISPETQNVLQLADQGQLPVDIARQLDRPVGEIELILSLNGRKPTAGP